MWGAGGGEVLTFSLRSLLLSAIMLGGVWSVLEELWGLFLGGPQSNKVNRQAWN